MKKMKKRLFSVLLAGVLCSAVVQGPAAVPASAASYNSSGVICDDRLGEGQIIFYPESLLAQDEATYPVIVWANGTMCAPALYYGLLSGLAEHGYIVIANRALFAGNGNAQRASIDFITAENGDAFSVFYGKADLQHIGAAGHSQGGMSAVNAAAADPRIDCVFSIAGNVQTASAAQLTVPAFYAAGSSDWIVPASLYVRPAYNSTHCTAVYASLKGAGHTKCCSSPGSYTGYMNAWFDAYLLGDAAAVQVFAPGGALSHDSSWTGYASKNL